VIEQVAETAQGNAVAALRRLALAGELVERLSARGIAAIILKGPTLAQDAYGDVGARDDRDLDLLIAEQQLQTAIDVLSARGLTIVEGPRRLTITRRTLDDPARRQHYAEAEFEVAGINVDLHWRLTRNRHLFPAGNLGPRALDVGGATIPALPMPEAFFYAMVHGTSHGWFRLKWIADVVGLVRQRPVLTALATLERAQHIGFERCVATGLLMAERMLGPFLVEEASNWAKSIHGIRALMLLSDRWLSADEEGLIGPPRSLREGVEVARLRLSMRSDRGYRREEAVQLLVDAGRLDRREQPPSRWTLARAPFSYLARTVYQALRARAGALSRSSRA
jgi:hypothetical protein